MRRSRLDVALGRQLAVSQTIPHRATGEVWEVAQVHRGDCHVELRRAGARQCIRFQQLRAEYDVAALTKGGGDGR